jgi:hypothetical protein
MLNLSKVTFRLRTYCSRSCFGVIPEAREATRKAAVKELRLSWT